MNKKGFTLAEMLGVITILAILGLLIFPAVDKSIKEGKKDLYRVQVSNIEQAAKEWVSDNIFIAPSKDGESMILTIYQLKEAGKLDNNITNPSTKRLFPDDMEIKITKTSSDYKAELIESTGTSETLTEYSPLTPKLKLNGDTVVYIEYIKNSTQVYSDAGVTALSNNNTSLSSNVTTATKNSLGNVIGSISYGQIGTYYVYYDVRDAGISVRVVRTVIVRDSEPPVISVPATTTVTRANAASYNLINTVTVTDQSTYTITTDRTSLPSVAGTYTITYTATDSFGNSSSARRTIKVQ